MEGAPPGHGAPGKAPVSRMTALGLGFLALVIIVAMVPLSVLAHSNPLANAGTGLALGVPFGAVGLIVLRRQRNLIGVYTSLVLLATLVLPRSSAVGVAVATLAAAALFSPLRRRVQQVVDRRFNRARYDADKTVAAFATTLKDTVDLDSAREDLASVVQKVLEPAHLSVWTNEGR